MRETTDLKYKRQTFCVSKMYVACLCHNSLLEGGKFCFYSLHADQHFMSPGSCGCHLFMQVIENHCCKPLISSTIQHVCLSNSIIHNIKHNDRFLQNTERNGPWLPPKIRGAHQTTHGPSPLPVPHADPPLKYHHWIDQS